MARGVRRARPDAVVETLPIADGGDGLIDAVRAALGGRLVRASARGPLGERRRAAYLWIPRRRLAVVEMARASGLALAPPSRRDPLRASSAGTGDLIRDALRRGAGEVVVGLGGAASSDGGAGMARALGARLLDADGREIPDGAAGLLSLERADAGECRRRLSGVRVTALADVTNPLCGPRGSARVFGPQKGATPAQVRVLESALARWARILSRDLGASVAAAPGAGAAGGLGAGLAAFARARIVPGADWVFDRVGVRRALGRADAVLTAEGRLDRTSLRGKAVVALARRARARGVPAAAIAGEVERAARPALRRAGILAAVSFASAGAASRADSLRRAARWAEKAAALALSGLALSAALALLPRPAAADGRLAESDRLYFRRDRPGNLEGALDLLDAALQARPDDAEALWRRGRCLVRRGESHPRKAERLADFRAAEKDLGRAVALSSAGAEAHFWLGVSLGRRGETQGILKSLFLVKPIRRELQATLRLDPGHGGAHRVLGEILWQLPGFAGGDKKKALAEFEAAVRLNPDHSSNYQPLAEAYLNFGRAADAAAVLKAVERIQTPADPAEYPRDLAEAAALLSRL